MHTVFSIMHSEIKMNLPQREEREMKGQKGDQDMPPSDAVPSISPSPYRPQSLEQCSVLSSSMDRYPKDGATEGRDGRGSIQ